MLTDIFHALMWPVAFTLLFILCGIGYIMYVLKRIEQEDLDSGKDYEEDL